MNTLKRTLNIIAAVQLVLGVVLIIPDLAATVLDLEDAPEWTNWLFAMGGARSLGFAYGMFVAARDPARHLSWIRAMIGVQLVDWIATMAYLASGAVTMMQVTTATFLPIVFIAILWQLSPNSQIEGADDVQHLATA